MVEAWKRDEEAEGRGKDRKSPRERKRDFFGGGGGTDTTGVESRQTGYQRKGAKTCLCIPFMAISLTH